MPLPWGPPVFEKALSPLQSLRACLRAGPFQLSSWLSRRKGLPSRERSWTSECHSGFTRDARWAVDLPTSPHDTVAPPVRPSRQVQGPGWGHCPCGAGTLDLETLKNDPAQPSPPQLSRGELRVSGGKVTPLLTVHERQSQESQGHRLCSLGSSTAGSHGSSGDSLGRHSCGV